MWGIPTGAVPLEALRKLWRRVGRCGGEGSCWLGGSLASVTISFCPIGITGRNGLSAVPNLDSRKRTTSSTSVLRILETGKEFCRANTTLSVRTMGHSVLSRNSHDHAAQRTYRITEGSCPLRSNLQHCGLWLAVLSVLAAARSCGVVLLDKAAHRRQK